MVCTKHLHMNQNTMDHDQMGHDPMGHDHSKMGSTPSCNMNMLFTWNTSNLCIIFEWWRVRGPVTLVFSLLGVIAFTALFEAIRSASRRYEQRVKLKREIEPLNIVTESTPTRSAGQRIFGRRRRTRFFAALIYALQSFYGLMLMLIFMTYNGWVMLSMLVGAFIGFLIFGEETNTTKDGACH